MFENADSLANLAEVFVAIAGFTGLIEVIQRSGLTEAERTKRTGYRLSFRLSMWGVILTILPEQLIGMRLTTNEIAVISGGIFFLIIFLELMHNLTLTDSDSKKISSNSHHKRWFNALKNLIANAKDTTKEKRNYFSKFIAVISNARATAKQPTEPPFWLYLYGFIPPIIIGGFFFLSFLEQIRHTFVSVYTLGIIWLLSFVAIHFIVYTHREWESPRNHVQDDDKSTTSYP